MNRPTAGVQAAARHRCSTKARDDGFSLIELMIAMVLGLIVIGSAIAVFSGSKRTAALNTTLTELQESARFALDSIVRDVRLAGFQGCTATPATVLATTAPTNDLFASAITSSLVQDNGDWLPAAPPGFSAPKGDAPGVPVPGTHTLSVQYGSPETWRIEPMATNSSAVVLRDIGASETGLVAGDLAMVSNCQVADLFQVSDVGEKTIAHDATANRGDPRLSAAYGDQSYQDDNSPDADRSRARLMRFEANIYYVGDTGRTSPAGDPVLSLYRQSLPFAGGAPIEMVEGVAHLEVRLGLRDPALNNDVVFVSPEEFTATDGRVERVEVGLLLQSYDRVTDQPNGRSYRLAGTLLKPAATRGATTYISDRRMRIAVNSAVSIRNRR